MTDVALMIDNGTGSIKVGFVSEDEPTKIIPTVIGRPKQEGMNFDGNQTDTYIGAEALSRREILSLENPIKKGQICNWEDLEKLWCLIFSNELRASTKDRFIHFTVPNMHSRIERQKTTEIMLESFNAAGIYISPQPVLAMYASGLVTGIVVNSGEGISNIAAVYEGCMISKGAPKMNFTGGDITEYLMRLLNERKFTTTTASQRAVAQEIKEKCSYVAFDFEKEIESTIERPYVLPDGNEILLGNERFQCAEAIFNPSLLGKEAGSVQDTVYNMIIKSEIDLRKLLYKNILLAGGNTMFPGFVDRLKKELVEIAPLGAQIKIKEATDRVISTWVGGSVLSSLSTFNNMWITRQEYEEFGSVALDKKCV